MPLPLRGQRRLYDYAGARFRVSAASAAARSRRLPAVIGAVLRFPVFRDRFARLLFGGHGTYLDRISDVLAYF